MTPVLPEVLETVPGESNDEQPRCARDRRGGDDDERGGNTAFHGDDDPTSVSDGEADVDVRDRG